MASNSRKRYSEGRKSLDHVAPKPSAMTPSPYEVQLSLSLDLEWLSFDH